MRSHLHLDSLRARLGVGLAVEDSTSDGQRAAVAAVLRQRPDRDAAELLFIRRAEHPADPWSGHMAFPGGRMDPEDGTVLVTAVRETLEELGLDLNRHATLLTRLPELPAVARGKRINLVISPFVFALQGAEADLQPSDEVAEHLWIPIAPLARGEGAGTVRYVHEGIPLELPCIRYEGRTIWGLTHQMLQALLARSGAMDAEKSGET